jgi:hypothetical protein
VLVLLVAVVLEVACRDGMVSGPVHVTDALCSHVTDALCSHVAVGGSAHAGQP